MSENSTHEQTTPDSIPQFGGLKAFLKMMGVEQNVLNELETEEDARTLMTLMNGMEKEEKAQLKLSPKARNTDVKPATKEALNSAPKARGIPRYQADAPILNAYTKDAYLPHWMILPGARILRLENKNGRMML